MKQNKLFLAILIGAIITIFSNCNPQLVPTNPTTTTIDAFVIDPTSSFIEWEGSKINGNAHQGTVPLANGIIQYKNEQLSGVLNLDMAGLENKDLDGDMKASLESHLKSPDFFDVEKYPTGSFKILSAEKLEEPIRPAGGVPTTHYINGELTLKGITKNIQFGAALDVVNNTLAAATTPFTINRTDWGITYASPTIVNQVKDKLISDEIKIKIQLVARQK